MAGLPAVSSLDRMAGTMAFIPLNHVFFPHDKSVLDQGAKRILNDAARYIMQSGRTERVIIYAHANSIAGKDYNDRLSDKRANAVRDYLLEQNIPADLIWSHGWGENDPIDENWTREGSRRNRRVEIYIVEYSR